MVKRRKVPSAEVLGLITSKRGVLTSLDVNDFVNLHLPLGKGAPLIISDSRFRKTVATSSQCSRYLEVAKSYFNGNLELYICRFFGRGTFHGCVFDWNVSLKGSNFQGSLSFEDCIIKGWLDLQDVECAWLDLSFAVPPKKIFVRENQVSRIQAAAPRVPLVVIPEGTTYPD